MILHFFIYKCTCTLSYSSADQKEPLEYVLQSSFDVIVSQNKSSLEMSIAIQRSMKLYTGYHLQEV